MGRQVRGAAWKAIRAKKRCLGRQTGRLGRLMRPKRPALFLKVSFHGERYALLNMSPSHPQSPNGRIYTIQEPSAACMCSMVNLYGDPVLVCRGKHHEFHRGFCHAPPN